MTTLASHVALVTGGARGIGRATAAALAGAGARVSVWDRDAAAVDEAVAALAAAGHDVTGMAVDVTDRTSVQEAVARLAEAEGRLDIVVNNAGITMDARLEKMTEAQFDTVIDVNLKGVFNVTQAAIGPMITAGNGGVVLNASSIVGRFGNFGQTNYAATKAGVIAMTQTWARELAKHRIRVNAVAPGFVLTDMTGKMPEKVLGMMADKTPLGRLGSPEDIAAAYLFLAGPGASFITGQVLGVDGGLVL
ncbi:MAG: 3-oxoacyl-ACP reductase FabG [Candidatus Sericytochromatia bacterium]|nr:3-oxoacyl-ACP reductase FabG [Candidatus Sericytochromatia bacterium]